ncbi:MAG: methyl-accepting chemotaxis protein [Dechloromonas sp.]|jgi:methyl-accepting chemotaxis protein|nr:methyl-accepting chemotaxis protein [Dechloromonas sp.]
MQALFKPSVAVLNRLRYPAKFLLIGSVVAVILAVFLFTIVTQLNRDITAAKNEVAGLGMLKPMNRLVQAMQQHRGLSSGVLNGNEAMKDKRAAKEKEVADFLSASETALSPELRAHADWKAVRDEWEVIRTQGLNWSAGDNVKRHTALIDRVLLFMVTVADATELTLDPVMDTYYMMDTVVQKMPALLEPLGVTRARGTGVLSKKELAPELKVAMAATLGQLSQTLRAQNINLGKVMDKVPATRPVLEPAAKQLTAEVDALLALVREDVLSERFQTTSDDYFKQATTVIDHGYQVMFETLIPQFEKMLAERQGDAERQRAAYVLGAMIGLVLAAFFAAGMYFSVLNSVEVFSRGAERLAGGDLTARFDLDGHDELHAAADHFNDMAGAFRKLLGNIQGGVQQLRVATEQLATSSKQIADSAGHQSDAASSMAASVEEMTVGVDHIARNAEDAQNHSRESDRVAARGGEMVGGIVSEIQRIAATVNESAAAVEALGQKSNEISAIVGAIKDIADQTNLLALNAAIEAARAGESGRGFAVVADEVRKLAERTAKSTQEITDMIVSIQTGTETAVTSMKQGVASVAVGVEQASRAGNTIEEAQACSRQVVGAVGEITGALREQAAASTEIAQNVEKIAQMAEENNAAAAANSGTAQELRRLAENLSQEVSRFKT